MELIACCGLIYALLFQTKCAPYWPPQSLSITHQHLTIKGKLEEKVGGIVKRTLVVNNMENQVVNSDTYVI